MHREHTIQLSGPFRVFDSSGRSQQIEAIRIFDEGYGIIDVYVDLAAPAEGEPLHEDGLVIGQILARLRSLGYSGPDFGLADLGMQDDKLIVLEAGEEFAAFAASKGWKNLASDYIEDERQDGWSEAAGDSASREEFAALMRRLRAR